MLSIKPLNLISVFQRTRAKTIRVKTVDIVSKLADQRNELFAVTVSVPATSAFAVTRVSKNTRIENRIERFSFGLHLLCHPIGLKKSRHFFIQSGEKPKPIVIRSQAFSRALRRLHIITWSFDWFTLLCPSVFVIG